MTGIEIELNPVDFITIGTVGPKGQRVFYLQASQGDQVIALTIEKEQASALGEAINEFIEDLDRRYPKLDGGIDDPMRQNLELRDPVTPLFRVAQMGLGYDEDRDLVVLVAQELPPTALGEEEDPPLTPDDAPEPGVVRMWCSRPWMRALSSQAQQTVQSGRADPRQNGRLVYYWT